MIRRKCSVILLRKFWTVEWVGSLSGWEFKFNLSLHRIEMGNIISNIHHRIVAVEAIPTPSMKSLTESQIKIIKRTWEIPASKVSEFNRSINVNWSCNHDNSQPLDSGEKILYVYFEKFPENQLKFAAFRNTPLMALKGELVRQIFETN